MSKEANYRELQEVPAWTRAVWKGQKVVNEADPFKWSGTSDPPAIGAKVQTFMNNLGAGTVIGYFVEYGWFGVRVQLDNPPAWRKQQHPDNPPAHLFGVDLEPRTAGRASQ